MSLNEALEIVEYHQEWRTGKHDEQKVSPAVLTVALNMVILAAKQTSDRQVSLRDLEGNEANL